jgi:ABC-type tungstate transport system substrate-binding protein
MLFDYEIFQITLLSLAVSGVSTLLAYSTAVLAAGLAALPFRGVRFSLGLVLGLSAALQTVILGLVLAGARLRFTGQGLALRAGSSLLHLGTVLFTLDLVALQGSPWHIPLFWVSTALLTAGCVLTFYVANQR